MSFIHLHLHSEYSLVDGLVRLDELTERCVELKMPAVAVTDLSNLFALVKFQKEAIKKGIKPIFGAELFINNESNESKPFRAVFLCKNQQGYQNLTCLISKGYLKGQYEEQIHIHWDWLQEHSEGLIVLSGGCDGDIGQAILEGNQGLAENRIQQWHHIFAQHFYLEIQRTQQEHQDLYNYHAIQLSQQFNIPVVATNNVRFLSADEFDAHEARVCIYQGYVLDDPKRPKKYTSQQYFKSSEEMSALFSDIPEALENTLEIAKRCNLFLTLGEVFLPRFPIPESTTMDDYFKQQTIEGFNKKIPYLFPQVNKPDEEKLAIYQHRLETELNVIIRMGFAGYFLIVADFIHWAKQNDVPVGPGRGSGAGSLVAYALGITGLDPLAYDLLFERFLNPERVSMPDFDIDFCMDGRDRVIEYVAKTYGEDKVSQIITFGTMAAKAVVRDVGRVLGFPYGFVDKIAKLIPFELGITLKKALEQEEELRKRYEQEDEVKGLIDLALKLEGLARNAGKHAGGVVIAPTQLTDFTPLYIEPGGKNPVTQFDKDDVEAVGLVKFDFLGLRTLTIIDWTLKTLNAKNQAQHLPLIDIEAIPLNDAQTFDLLKRCETTGVFQLESRGMKDLIRRLQPDCFEDIIALVALFRPGPLQSGMVDDFINRKHGRSEIVYPHSDLEAILKPTYGVILYQEQVMQIAQVLANYTLGEADMLRRAMGKKKPEEMAKQREVFVQGAAGRGIAKELSGSIFDLMEKFAGYGFNKSHSAAYALVSYQTAWLKCHYPAAFMAAVLSSDMDNTDKVANFINESRQMKLTILGPDIHQSHYAFTVAGDEAIRYGLGAIKGAGEAAIELILEARKQQPFQSLKQFCERLDLRKVNRRVIEALIKAGAFYNLNSSRTVLLNQLDYAMQAAEQYAKRKSSGQSDLFSTIAESENNDPNTEVEHHDTLEKILEYEKEVLGYYFSGHPLTPYEKELQHLGVKPMIELSLDYSQSVRLAGIITQIRILLNRRNEKMAFLTLEDQSSRAEIAVFSDVYQNFASLLKKDEIILMDVQITIDDQGQARINAKQCYSFVNLRERLGEAVILKIIKEKITHEQLDELLFLISNSEKGNLSLILNYENKEARTKLALPKRYWIKTHDIVLKKLRQLLGDDNVLIQYRK